MAELPTPESWTSLEANLLRWALCLLIGPSLAYGLWATLTGIVS